MQIQLKQAEIVIALKQYIAAQGINLVGKDVSISFTAGRKEAGIVADLVIEDGAIPGFSDADDEVSAASPAPTLSVVTPTPTPPVKKVDAPVSPVASVAVEDTPFVDATATPVTEPADAPKTTSLFN